MKLLKIILIVGFLVFCQFCLAKPYYVAKTGSDQNSGDRNHPFLTISHAALLALPGDVVIVHAGIYRELVAPPRGHVIYEAAPGERVLIKGSEVVNGWNRENDGRWRKALPNTFFGDYNPYNDPIYGDWFFPKGEILHTGEVYIDGKALSEISQWTCQVTRDSTILIANYEGDINHELVEINVRPSCFYPAHTGVNYITVKGFALCQAATQWAAPTAEQVGVIGTNWSKGWIIEDNTIYDSKCVGITLGKDRASGQNPWSADMSKEGSVIYNDMVKTVIAEGWNKANIGSHIVRNNEIYNCGEAGICGSFGAAYSQIIHNHIHDIYTGRAFYGAEMAGIKLHGAIDVLIRGNQVNNTFIGIWLDWMAQGTRVSGNLLYNNDYVDFFPEVNHGPYIADNNLFLSPISIKDWSEGGTYIKNLVAGNISRAPQERQTPFFKPHTTQLAGATAIRGGDDRFYGNIFLKRTVVPQPPKMHGADQPDSIAGYGLAIYKNATLPVKTGGNIELAAKQMSCRIEQRPDGVYLLISGAAINAVSPVATTDLLGTAIIPQQRFEAPDGKSIIFDENYFGAKRVIYPGPFPLTTINETLRVW